MKKRVKNKLVVFSIVVAIILLAGILIYNYFQKGVLLSPPVPTSSYTCYKIDKTSVTCSAGQYCVSGGCSNYSIPSYVSYYGCYSPTGSLQQCNNSQLCYNGVCK